MKTRYTGIGFWMAGLQLFEATLKVAMNKDEMENMKSLIAKAHEIIGDSQENASMPRSVRGGGIYILITENKVNHHHHHYYFLLIND